MKKKIVRIVMLLMTGVIAVGVVLYEAYSIVEKEYARQTDLAEEVQEQVDFNLNMMKIAVQTNDAETYVDKVENLKNEMAKMDGLFMIQEEWAEYITLMDEYVGVLDGKEAEIAEVKELKAEVAEIAKAMREKYGNKDEITRDKIAGAKNEIAVLKLEVNKYSSEKVVAVAEAVNMILDGIVEKVGALADCVDTCYKNRISEINDELAEKLKDFGNKAKDLNIGFEKEFEFEKMEAIKNGGAYRN